MHSAVALPLGAGRLQSVALKACPDRPRSTRARLAVAEHCRCWSPAAAQAAAGPAALAAEWQAGWPETFPEVEKRHLELVGGYGFLQNTAMSIVPLVLLAAQIQRLFCQ